MAGNAGQRNRIVIGSVIAVAGALGLAVFVSYAAPGTSSIQVQSTCTNTGSFPILSLPPVVQVSENGTVVVGGVSYWYVTLTSGFPNHTSTITFHGVNFTLEAYSKSWDYKESTITIGSGPVNFTFGPTRGTYKITLPDGSQYCGRSIPPIDIAFGDGSVAKYDNQNVTIRASDNGIWFMRPLGSPWFTLHSGPRAGVGYQDDGTKITLFVSIQ
jgi:hypothetical protein